MAETTLTAKPALPEPETGLASNMALEAAAKAIHQATLPIVFLGEEASRCCNTAAIRTLLEKTRLPVVSTFQAAGVTPRDLADLFVGRVGLFQNQPGDQLMDAADLILTVGFNTVEYDPETWNAKGDKTIIHLDYNPAKIHNCYRPSHEVIGDIAKNILHLTEKLNPKHTAKNPSLVKKLNQTLLETVNSGAEKIGIPVHPLRFIHELRNAIDDDTRVICDVGSVYMWFARNFLCFKPHHLLFSNGQQTLGVALPWAMGVHFAHPKQSIVSVSGDGGFLFSAMELETAVREKCNWIHFIWQDKRYDMVYEQELMKYQRGSGVDFGELDIPAFAKGFGATGFVLDNPDDFTTLFQKAKTIPGPVLINVPIDYSDNPAMFDTTHKEVGN